MKKQRCYHQKVQRSVDDEDVDIDDGLEFGDEYFEDDNNTELVRTPVPSFGNGASLLPAFQAIPSSQICMDDEYYENDTDAIRTPIDTVDETHEIIIDDNCVINDPQINKLLNNGYVE